MRPAILAAACILAAATLTGCSVDTHKQGDGDNVKIDTPFGGMSVKTGSGDVLASIGLPLYPGATPVKKEHEDGKYGSGSADVNMSFGSFQLKVKAAEYRTDDTPEQVFAFYKKVLNRYGTVIQCRHGQPAGTPARTPEGLACDDDHYPGKTVPPNPDGKASGNGVSVFEGDAMVQLKAGSKKHQHIVDINPDGIGAHFGLVSLDLPIDFDGNGNKDGSKKEGRDDRQ